MFISDLIFVIIIVAVLTAVFGAGFGRRRGSSLLAFFLILFALTWATGLWVVPFGVPVMGTYWLPFLTLGVLFSILLLALAQPVRPVEEEEVNPRQREAATPDREAFGVFFWILMVLLFLAIIAGYAY